MQLLTNSQNLWVQELQCPWGAGVRPFICLQVTELAFQELFFPTLLESLPRLAGHQLPAQAQPEKPYHRVSLLWVFICRRTAKNEWSNMRKLCEKANEIVGGKAISGGWRLKSEGTVETCPRGAHVCASQAPGLRGWTTLLDEMLVRQKPGWNSIWKVWHAEVELPELSGGPGGAMGHRAQRAPTAAGFAGTSAEQWRGQEGASRPQLFLQSLRRASEVYQSYTCGATGNLGFSSV